MHQHCINVSFCFVLWSHSSFCFLILMLGLSRPDRSATNRPNRPTTTRFRPELKVQSIGGGFPFSKTDTGKSSDGFASPKPEQPEPTGATKKSDQILQKQARSGEISTKSREISTKSGYI